MQKTVGFCVQAYALIAPRRIGAKIPHTKRIVDAERIEAEPVKQFGITKIDILPYFNIVDIKTRLNIPTPANRLASFIVPL